MESTLRSDDFLNWIDVHTVEPPTLTDRFEVGGLEPGLVHRLFLRLTENAVHQPIRVPIMVLRGAEPGPVVGITAAIHGNELNGIRSIQRLFETIDPAELAGTLVGVTISNAPGYIRNQRVFSDGQDLNTLMPGSAHGNDSQVYAYRFCERVLPEFDYLLDLHTASFGRINCIYARVDTTHAVATRMARVLRPQIIVHNAGDKTLRGAAMALGIPAITVEIGDPQVFDSDDIRSTRIGIRDVIEDIGLIPPDSEIATGEAVECVRSSWLYTDTGGLLRVLPEVATIVKKGEVIATLRDPWGQILRTYRAPVDGIVIGKATNPAATTGARILHLGILGSVGG